MTPAIVVAAVAAGFICGLAVLDLLARRRRPRRARREATVRSALFRTLDETSDPDRILDDLPGPERRLIEAKARALLPALRGEDRETLARLLESRGATETARHQCRSRRATRRAAACLLLGDVGSSFAVLDLVPLLDDHRQVVRLAAARALGRLGQPAGVAPLMRAVERETPLPIDAAADAIQQIRDWPLSLLQPCLTDPSEPTRALAVELLGRYQAMDCVHALIELLEGDPSTEVRVRAARALGRIGSAHAVHPLLRGVDSGPEDLRVESVAALGRLGAAAAIPMLRVTLLTPSPRLSQAAAAALAAISPQGVDLLAEIADDHRHPACPTARRALAAREAMTARLLPDLPPRAG